MTRFLLLTCMDTFFDTNHQRKIPILGGPCSEWHWDKSNFEQNSAVIWLSAYILQYKHGETTVYKWCTVYSVLQYPLKLKVFGALWSPFFTIGNWLLTLCPPFLQWCEDRNVNRIGPEYNQSTQKSYIIWGLIFLLVSSYFATWKHKTVS